MAEPKTIFQYLKEYNLLSNPVVTEVKRQLWQYRVNELPEIPEIWSVFTTNDFNSERLIEVGKPELSPCPQPDKILTSWIVGEWANLSVEEISHRDTIIEQNNDPDVDTEHIVLKFEDDSSRVAAFEKWSMLRAQWYEKEKRKDQGLRLYNSLYKLYSRMINESESVELVLGEGRLRWNLDGKVFDHPVLMQRVKLEFDTEKPSFIVTCEEPKTELYTAMLRMFHGANQTLVGQCIEEVDDGSYHIADTENISKFFERLANVIDTSGRFVDAFDADYKGLAIKQEPVLFLRKRTLGYSRFLNKILEKMDGETAVKIPSFLDVMIGRYHDEEENIESPLTEHWNESGIDQDVLLTLPANNEQLRIIKYLEHSGAVLVQGPPGTGKTHTIANLIGHLLSQGKSVLVTSHTEKALSVLKEKVYPELQSLCVSVMRGKSQRKEMDATLFEIAEKSSEFDRQDNQKKIDKLEKERKVLIEDLKWRKKELLTIRSDEYKDLVLDNHTISPIEAAKFIKNGEGKVDYINGEIKDDQAGMPLSYEELVELYGMNRLVSQEEELILKNKLPDIDKLLQPDQFQIWVAGEQEKKKALDHWVPVVHLMDNTNAEATLVLCDKVAQMHKNYKGLEELQRKIIFHSLEDGFYQSLWEKFFESFDQLLRKYEAWRSILFEHKFDIDESWYKVESLGILDEILKSNKEEPVSGLGFLLKKTWKEIRDGIRMDGQPLKKKSDYEIVRDLISYELERRENIARVNKLFLAIEAELIKSDQFENQMKLLKRKVDTALKWYNEVWGLVLAKISVHVADKASFKAYWLDIDSDQIAEIVEKRIDLLHSDFSQRKAYLEYQKFNQEILTFEKYLGSFSGAGDIVVDLLKATEKKDVVKYKEVYEKLVSVNGKYGTVLRKRELIKKINTLTPQWAEDILARRGVHGGDTVPENVADAWKWRQLSNQLKRLDQHNPNHIQRQIEHINRQLRRNAERLAYVKAWAGMELRQTQEMRQHLNGWRTTMRQIGSGKGKRAPKLLQKARESMTKCQGAVPVWIMPLNRVVENFDPASNEFDVIIIDEASQANILALSVLFMGKTLIVVGDDQQVSPDSIGQRTDEIDALITQYLPGVPNNHLYNGQSSVYDMAISAGFKPIMLTEHFRCLPEIIEFSNQLAYNGKIKPLRDSSGVMTTPAVVEYRVPDGLRDRKKVNTREAQHITSLVQACIEDPRYENKTIGIISMLGNEQSDEINMRLQREIAPKVMEVRKIQCGTPPSFQGDERDIIFLSLVEGPKEKGGPVRMMSEEGRNDMYKKRYNVAASRAKDQLWVVHSLNPEVDLKPDDIRLKLIKHAIQPSDIQNGATLGKAESDFERRVMKSLLGEGYKVLPQWKVGAYRIDMVIESGNNRIALECDGERFHTQDDLPNDLKRQAILERLGWTFIRIRGSAYYRNPEETMKWLYSELESYDIYPSNELPEATDEEDDVLEAIKRRAQEIRNEQNKDDVSPSRAFDFIESADEDTLIEKSAEEKTEPTGGLEDEEQRQALIVRLKEIADQTKLEDKTPEKEKLKIPDRGLVYPAIQPVEPEKQEIKQAPAKRENYQKGASPKKRSEQPKRTVKSKRSSANRVGADITKPKFDFRKSK